MTGDNVVSDIVDEIVDDPVPLTCSVPMLPPWNVKREMRNACAWNLQKPSFGRYIGYVKWFSDTLNYGFITMCEGVTLCRDDGAMMGDEVSVTAAATSAAAVAAAAGRDIFVHHTGIQPHISAYKTLRKGEYVSMNLCVGSHGPQAIDVTGIAGGPLTCDCDALASLHHCGAQNTCNDNAAYGAGFRGGGRAGASHGGRRVFSGCHPWWLDPPDALHPSAFGLRGHGGHGGQNDAGQVHVESIHGRQPMRKF